MLSDDELIQKQCPECGGRGEIEVDVPRPMSFSRDIGEIDTEWWTCDVCHGYGEIENDIEYDDEE